MHDRDTPVAEEPGQVTRQRGSSANHLGASALANYTNVTLLDNGARDKISHRPQGQDQTRYDDG